MRKTLILFAILAAAAEASTGLEFSRQRNRRSALYAHNLQEFSGRNP